MTTSAGGGGYLTNSPLTSRFLVTVFCNGTVYIKSVSHFTATCDSSDSGKMFFFSSKREEILGSNLLSLLLSETVLNLPSG